MKPRDFVSPDYLIKVENLSTIINDLIPLFDNMVSHGMPLADHLDKLKAYKVDVDKLVTLLEIK